MSRVFEAMQDELSKETAMNELGLGQTVELSVSGKVIGIEMDSYKPERLIYRVELRDERGVFLSTVNVIDSMIVRVGK